MTGKPDGRPLNPLENIVVAAMANLQTELDFRYDRELCMAELSVKQYPIGSSSQNPYLAPELEKSDSKAP
jgi:hypothetical protein